jgi:hypothetical protein
MRNTKPPVAARSPGPRTIEVLAQKRILGSKKVYRINHIAKKGIPLPKPEMIQVLALSRFFPYHF